ncbi:MAG: hypothetical protein IPJ47_17955 [Anaerolineales bacterium]|nr:hypothetical protein [Anaerolineales bacterium]
MKDDVKKYIFGAVAVFLVGVFIWVGIVFVNACGLSFSCKRGELAVARTPIPTMIPATLPAMEIASSASVDPDKCHVAGVGWWVHGLKLVHQDQVFEFTDANGVSCEATFADVSPLFHSSQPLVFGLALLCLLSLCDTGCFPAQLDLSSYDGIIAGSRRADDAPKGTDILGGGKWTSSLLYQFLAETKADVPVMMRRFLPD